MGLNAILPTSIYTYDLNPPKKVYDNMVSYMDDFLERNKDNIGKINLTGDTIDEYLIFNNPVFSWLNGQVAYHVKRYLKALKYDITQTSIHAQKAWPVIVPPDGGSIGKHTHKNSHLSLVYYLKTQEQYDDEHCGGDLLFVESIRSPMHLVPIQSNKGDSRYRFFDYFIEPSDNKIVIFPSTLEHEVSKYYGDDYRYSVSYDIMITTKKNPLKHDLEMCTLHPSMWLEIC